MESELVPEEQWKKVQEKTFTKWMNTKLRKAGMEEVASLYEEAQTGLPFARLFKALGKAALKHNVTPKSRISRMENVTYVLEYIKSQNVTLVNIGSPDIVDGDQKLILGLVWTIISRMSMTEAFDSSCYSIRDDLLAWVQKVTEPYENVCVKNFTTSWRDGLAFNAVIHRFRPEYINYAELSDHNPIQNLDQAFAVAENKLDIPRLLDAEDVVESVIPDEKSIMTYVFELYKKFKAEESQIASKSVLSVFMRGLDWSIGARNDYSERARLFLERKAALERKAESACALFVSLLELVAECEQMNSALIAESSGLHLLLSDIDDASRLFNLRPFAPPADLALDKMQIGYQTMDMDLEALRRGLQDFTGKDAQTILALRDACNDFLGIADKQEQAAQISGIGGRLEACRVVGDSKNDVLARLREIVASKGASLSKFTECNRHHKWVLETAKKLFNVIDVKKSGVITQSDCKKIIRSLKYDVSAITEPLNDYVTLDVLLRVISSIFTPIATPAQLRTAFEVLGENGSVKLSELDNIKGYANLGLSGKDSLSYADFTPHISE